MAPESIHKDGKEKELPMIALLGPSSGTWEQNSIEELTQVDPDIMREGYELGLHQVVAIHVRRLPQHDLVPYNVRLGTDHVM